jgi:antitoxin component of RelBE/YafQ-DinJ toxin-antitoxin module
MKMEKRYTKLLRSLNENKDGQHVHISVGLNHDIMAVHNSKEAGMKYMVMGDGPDGHFLVKTTRKALGKKRVGQFVGSRISRHLDKQPFPHDDGPHYSVHKELDTVNASVEIDEEKTLKSRAKNVVRGMGVDPDDVIRGMGKGPHAEKDKARAAKEQKPTLKSRAKNVARGMGVDPDNVMRGMGFKESVLPSSITPPLAPKEDRDRSDRVRDHELARRHHERQMTRDPENKKYHLQQASLHSAAEDAGAEVSRIAPGKLRDAANRDFEIKSKKALGESVEVSEAHAMVCKDCGDELNKPTTDCANDCSDPNGSHWVKEYSEATEDKVRARTLRRRDAALIALKRNTPSQDGDGVNEEMSPEAKARVASLRNTPSQIAARKAAAKNKMVRPGTEADLPKDHDWNDRDAYPKESTEVDELAQMVPNKSQLNKDQATKMSKLDDELKAMRARMAEETQNEDYELTEEDLPEAWTPTMRRAAARRMKILAPRIKLGIKRSKNRTATKEKLMNRAVKKVKNDLIKKFTKGEKKTDLSPARRAEMEKRIAKLGPRIKQLAQKQLPVTRRMEADRKRNRNK